MLLYVGKVYTRYLSF